MKPLIFICRQKINFILHVFHLRYCKDMAKPFILGPFSMPGSTNPNKRDTINLSKTFVYPQAKKIKSPRFSGYIAKICKLLILGTLDMPSYAHPKWQYQPIENFSVHLHHKNTLHNSLLSSGITFKRILQFDWPSTFWPITPEPEFCHILDWWWNQALI